MVRVDQTTPADMEDRWNLCVWRGRNWPCPPRRLAERADEASRRPWRESWTARHDLNGPRADLAEAGERIPRNRGLFD